MVINTNRLWIQLMRWFLCAALIVVALYSLGIAAYHGWAASFPDARDAKWHTHWSNIFLVASLLSFVAATWLTWFLRRRKNGTK